ncbi:T9SS type A sorting domain-containing protein [Reichenbachiella versicolor]|uniref:T9SS type A sorting domain-containing protein n=1 Tax=Reichenbachiella versicolor TaxID=1821036 RepID=UPI000D6DD130|nr:T9SS type A sorting domain-containing protein [Reichenbachiella versicolor]
MRVIIVLILIIPPFLSFSQCPTGDYTGNISLTADCTISSNITVTGDITFNSTSKLTINPGVTLTISGELSSSYNSGVLEIDGGGILNTGGRVSVGQLSSMTFDNVTASMNNTSSSAVISMDQSTLILENGASFTVVQGNFRSANAASLSVVNSSLTVSDGNLLIDYQGTFNLTNSNLTLSNGDFQTENETVLTITGSNLSVDGNMNVDYLSDMTINGGSNVSITGDFNNGIDPTGTTVTNGDLIVDNATFSIGGDLNNQYGSSVTVDGGGAITVSGSINNFGTATISTPGGSVTLPIELIAFAARQEGNAVEVNWSTASELDNEHFYLYRSTNGVDYVQVAEIDGAGTSSTMKEYSYKDSPSSSGRYYYKLKQVDYSGVSEEFSPVGVYYELLFDGVQLFPNPTKDFIEVAGVTESGLNNISITSVDGSFGYSLSADFDNGTAKINLAFLPSGLYVLHFESAGVKQNYRISKI